MQSFLGLFKKHIVSFVIILFISFGFFLPALSGKKLVQKDIIEALSMQGEMKRYRDNGEHILWTNNMFSGMPTFQIRHYSGTNFIGNTIYWLYDLINNPAFYLMVGMLGIYFFCLLFEINKWLALIASIAYALSSFNIISLEAGHTSKVLSMAFVAPMLASIVYTFKGNLLSGTVLTAFFTAFQVRTNHMQITYYAVMIISILVVFELIRHLREKKINQFLKAGSLLIVAGLIGIMSNATLLLTTYDYSKSTMRGGATELKSKKEQSKGGGLDKDYAFAWSHGILESFSFIVPGFSGGASVEQLDESSKTFKTLTSKGYTNAQAKSFTRQVPTYWGNQPFTAGPIYFGAIVIFLFLFGLLTSRNQLKWWMLASVIFALMLSWGKNLSVIADFFFNYVPMYNKFRTPSMALSMVMIFIPVLAVFGLQELFINKIDKHVLLRNLKISGGVTVGFCMLLWLCSGMFSYKSDNAQNNMDNQYFENYKNATRSESFANEMIKALKADREAMLKSDALRSALFIALAALLIYLFVQSKIKFEYMAAGIGLLILIDLWTVDNRYLNSSSYVENSEYEKNFSPRGFDNEILRDKELYFRVHDVTKDPFNTATVSYFHKTIGGYHAAKLQRYQDFIEAQIRKGNMNVLNMLNVKYFIVSGPDKKPQLQINPSKLGNAWAVKKIIFANDADEELSTMDNLETATTAVADIRYKNEIGNDTFEIGNDTLFSGTGNIKLAAYHPEKLTYSFESDEQQFIVFSEVYYHGNKDWISYIDGKEAPHIRVNYILRGMKVPAGKHEIVFEFKPKSFYLGEKISLASNILLLLIAGGYFFKRYKGKR